jgi:hypothetical protein
LTPYQNGARLPPKWYEPHQKASAHGTSWTLDVPRDLMRKVKMAEAHEGKSVKEFLMELARARIEELERKGVFPKGK